jgi:SHS2 domain-containing protein
MNRGHRVFDHTADLGIEAWGPDLPAVFDEAARALFEIILDPSGIAERVTRDVRIEASETDLLFKEWLSELLFFFSSQGLAFRRFEILELGETGLRARLHGEEVSPERHELRKEIKAITYHQLHVGREADGWKARIIVDI